MRISWRTLIFKAWKDCFWVFDKPDLLLVFREPQHYFDYYKNPFLDGGAREYIIKKEVKLAANYM